MEVVNQRKTKVQSFYFSIQELEGYWGQRRAYHHTSPIAMTYALREALRMMIEEGIENRLNRHARVRRHSGPVWRPWAWDYWWTLATGLIL